MFLLIKLHMAKTPFHTAAKAHKHALTYSTGFSSFYFRDHALDSFLLPCKPPPSTLYTIVYVNCIKRLQYKKGVGITIHNIVIPTPFMRHVLPHQSRYTSDFLAMAFCLLADVLVPYYNVFSQHSLKSPYSTYSQSVKCLHN